MIIIRDAKTEDLLSIAKVKIDTWHSTYRGFITDDVLDKFDLSEQAEKFGELIPQGCEKKFLIVAEANGTIVGFAAGGSERDGKYGIDGEVYAVYVHEKYQNQGIGNNLMVHSAEKLANMGFESMLVWVLEDNPFKRFYEKYGGTQIDKKPFEISDNGHFVVAYAWKDGFYWRDINND